MSGQRLWGMLQLNENNSSEISLLKRCPYKQKCCLSFFWLNMLWCSRIFVFFTLLNLNQTRYVSLNLKRSVFSCTLSSAAHRSLWGYLSEHLNRVLTFCAETNFTAAVPFLLSVRCRGNTNSSWKTDYREFIQNNGLILCRLSQNSLLFAVRRIKPDSSCSS